MFPFNQKRSGYIRYIFSVLQFWPIKFIASCPVFARTILGFIFLFTFIFNMQKNASFANNLPRKLITARNRERERYAAMHICINNQPQKSCLFLKHNNSICTSGDTLTYNEKFIYCNFYRFIIFDSQHAKLFDICLQFTWFTGIR